MFNRQDIIYDITEAYQGGQFSLNQLSIKCKLSINAIKRHLIEANIPLRSKKECYELNGIHARSGYKNHKLISKQHITKKSQAHVNYFEIFARDGFRCRYCGKTPQEDGVKLIVEHIIPLSQGGGNNKANFITACQNCNNSKRNRVLLSNHRQIPSFIAITTLE